MNSLIGMVPLVLFGDTKIDNFLTWAELENIIIIEPYAIVDNTTQA